eukprot:TRINITY_DN53896_c0_g1_i1.p1 TRINITY_DN53896_c0_g1~~TRINITY_DN53896_c0_g1_i1.p1  ORF type:complete len:564 (+),score=122.80 TRINITY_DN53896_c0_g1_i1:51-1694(+)
MTPTADDSAFQLSGLLVVLFTLLLGTVVAAFFLRDGKKVAAAASSSASSPEASVPPSAAAAASGSTTRVRQSDDTPSASPAAKAAATPTASAPSPSGATTSSPAAQPSKRGPDRIGGGDLWLWRGEALRRVLAAQHLQGASEEELVAIRRIVWAFLDDRPRYISSGCADGQARILDARSLAGKQLVSVRHDAGSRDAINSIVFASGGAAAGPLVLTGTWDGKWHTWENWPQKPNRPTEFARGERGIGHENLVSSLGLSRDGKKLAVGCTVGRVMVFRGQCPVKEITVHEEESLKAIKEALKLGDYGELYLKEALEVEGAALEAMDELLSEAAFQDKKSKRDVDKLPLPAVLRFRFTGCLTHGHKRAWRHLEHEGAVRCLVLSVEGAKEYLYSGCRDRQVRKFALEDGSLVHSYQGHSAAVRCLAVNEDWLVSGSDDRSLRVWHKAAPDMARVLTGHGDFVRAVALCPNLTNRLVSSADDGKVILWDVTTGERLLDYEHKAVVASLLLNASLLVSGSEDGRVRAWRTESGDLEWQVKHPGAVNALAWL